MKPIEIDEETTPIAMKNCTLCDTEQVCWDTESPICVNRTACLERQLDAARARAEQAEAELDAAELLVEALAAYLDIPKEFENPALRDQVVALLAAYRTCRERTTQQHGVCIAE